MILAHAMYAVDWVKFVGRPMIMFGHIYASYRPMTLPVPDDMVDRALRGFDTGTVDPNDYRRRMKLALEAALKG